MPVMAGLGPDCLWFDHSRSEHFPAGPLFQISKQCYDTWRATMDASGAGFGTRPEEQRQEIARQGAEKRNEALSPARKAYIASVAAYSRWYNVSRPHDRRIDDHLKSLARIAVRAMMQEDDAKLLKVHAVMAAYERMKLWMDQRAGNVAIPVELQEEGNEAMRKFQEGQKQSEIETTAEKVEEKK